MMGGGREIEEKREKDGEKVKMGSGEEKEEEEEGGEDEAVCPRCAGRHQIHVYGKYIFTGRRNGGCTAPLA